MRGLTPLWLLVGIGCTPSSALDTSAVGATDWRTGDVNQTVGGAATGEEDEEDEDELDDEEEDLSDGFYLVLEGEDQLEYGEWIRLEEPDFCLMVIDFTQVGGDCDTCEESWVVEITDSYPEEGDCGDVSVPSGPLAAGIDDGTAWIKGEAGWESTEGEGFREPDFVFFMGRFADL